MSTGRLMDCVRARGASEVFHHLKAKKENFSFAYPQRKCKGLPHRHLRFCPENRGREQIAARKMTAVSLRSTQRVRSQSSSEVIVSRRESCSELLLRWTALKKGKEKSMLKSLTSFAIIASGLPARRRGL